MSPFSQINFFCSLHRNNNGTVFKNTHTETHFKSTLSFKWTGRTYKTFFICVNAPSDFLLQNFTFNSMCYLPLLCNYEMYKQFLSKKSILSKSILHPLCSYMYIMHTTSLSILGKQHKNVDDSSCTTQIFVQSNSL